MDVYGCIFENLRLYLAENRSVSCASVSLVFRFCFASALLLFGVCYVVASLPLCILFALSSKRINLGGEHIKSCSVGHFCKTQSLLATTAMLPLPLWKTECGLWGRGCCFCFTLLPLWFRFCLLLVWCLPCSWFATALRLLRCLSADVVLFEGES